ncbi:DNA cross-link repair 1A protein-like [Vanessa tameamea]|uniref:DNA cross-link repair 1A protein-like n=1 Tax=Vanessa tameamea TaxID=334116 RepID=A0A8B8HXL2_VANTA
MNNDDINTYLPSILNPRAVKIFNKDISLTQNSTVSRSSLTLKRNNTNINVNNSINQDYSLDKENLRNKINCYPTFVHNVGQQKNISDVNSLGFSAIEDINSINDVFSLSSFPLKLEVPNKNTGTKNICVLSIPSTPELHREKSIDSDKTIIYDVHEKPVISLSFSVSNCDNVDIKTKKSHIKNIVLAHNKTDIDVDCEILEGSELSEDTINSDINMNDSLLNTSKRKAVSVNLEIKKQKVTGTEEKPENTKILILNTNAIEKLTHIIVQPPNYKLVKRKIIDTDNYINSKQKPSYVSVIKHGKHVKNEHLKQQSIDTYLKSNNISKIEPVVPVKDSDSLGNDAPASVCHAKKLGRNDAQEMNRNSVVADLIGRTSHKQCPEPSRSPRISLPRSPSPKREVKSSISEAQRASSSRSKKDSAGSLSPRRNIDSIQFTLPVKSKSNKTSAVARNIPYHKIVTGTHFAVDAFSYGEIPNIKHYFLTHFHSDHYMGLNRNFNKMLFCSKITADLCVLRLGVSFKRVHIINLDETIVIDGVEVTAIDANHCPGALMFVFTLPNGKSILHTGDFRASDVMESYPVFWNKDVHTIYLDTTYCNPRYDFPKQDQSLEMALNLLREKKTALEKVGKKFSSVLIVCGTYTIGKEKFFHGMARRVGCTVWACPEKDLVLQTVEGRSFSLVPPQSCQLHVVPMRDLTHEKMRSYLANLKGAFSEVVAFKPSGWENGKSPSVEKDSVTIHGIPYSEHSSFSELIRFVKFLKPKQVIPTVYISGGIKAVQKYFPCPLISKEDIHCQSKLTDYFTIQNQQQVPAVT